LLFRRRSLYVRFIGDRTIQERDFGKIQKDRVKEMKKWLRYIKREDKGEKKTGTNKDVALALVTANNHYAGFGPGTANIFKMIGLEEAKWEDIGYEHQPTNADKDKIVSKQKQTTLSDFVSS
jgi:hypothetical protein